MLSYAGVPLTIATPEMTAWVEANIPPLEFAEFDSQRWPGPRLVLHSYSNRGMPSKIRLGSLWWPRDASRWAVGHFVCSSLELDEIRRKVYRNTDYLVQPLYMSEEDDRGSLLGEITALMWMLPPRPLTAISGSDGLWLLTLVDDRYWWQINATAEPDVIEGTTTWDSLYDQLQTPIGTTITRESVHADYLYPSRHLRSRYERASTILDAVAFNVGHRIVRQLDGTVEAIGYETSAARVDASFAAVRNRKAGGAYLLTPEVAPNDLPGLIPSHVTLVCPRYDDKVLSLTELYEVSVSLTSLDLEEYGTTVGSPAKKVFHETAYANYTTGPEPDTGSLLTTLARRFATDWYLYRLADLDAKYHGIHDWQLEGLHDAVSWHYRSDEVSTQIHRGTRHDLTNDLMHSVSPRLSSLVHQIGSDTPSVMALPRITVRDESSGGSATIHVRDVIRFTFPGATITEPVEGEARIEIQAGVASPHFLLYRPIHQDTVTAAPARGDIIRALEDPGETAQIRWQRYGIGEPGMVLTVSEEQLPEWKNPPPAAPHGILSVTHFDTDYGDGYVPPVYGAIIRGNQTDGGIRWQLYGPGESFQVLTMIAGLPTWADSTHRFLSLTHIDTVPAEPILGDMVVATYVGGNLDDIRWQRLEVGDFGQVLTVIDGLPTWADPGGDPHKLLSVTHYDTVPTLDGEPVSGDLVVGRTQPDDSVKWQRFAKGEPGQVLTSSGLGLEWENTFHNLLSTIHPDTEPAEPVFGDLIYAGVDDESTPVWKRLPIGDFGQVLTVIDDAPVWMDPDGGATAPHKILSPTHSDVLVPSPGEPNPAEGDILRAKRQFYPLLDPPLDTPIQWERLPIGTEDQVLTSIAGLPRWATPPSAGGFRGGLLESQGDVVDVPIGALFLFSWPTAVFVGTPGHWDPVIDPQSLRPVAGGIYHVGVMVEVGVGTYPGGGGFVTGGLPGRYTLVTWDGLQAVSGSSVISPPVHVDWGFDTIPPGYMVSARVAQLAAGTSIRGGILIEPFVLGLVGTVQVRLVALWIHYLGLP